MSNYKKFFTSNAKGLLIFLLGVIIAALIVIKDNGKWAVIIGATVIAVGAGVGTWIEYRKNKKWINED